MNMIKLLIVLLVSAAVPATANAQTSQGGGSSFSNMFGGMGGIANAFNLNRSPGVDQQPASNPLSGLQGGLQGLIPGMGGQQQSSNPLGSLQGLMPALGGQQNNSAGTDILSRVNQKSKDALDRTTNWARQKKQEMTSKMVGNSLGNLIPALKPQAQSGQTSGPFDWLKSKVTQPPTQPPLRSAQNYGQQPSIRY